MTFDLQLTKGFVLDFIQTNTKICCYFSRCALTLTLSCDTVFSAVCDKVNTCLKKTLLFITLML